MLQWKLSVDRTRIITVLGIVRVPAALSSSVSSSVDINIIIIRPLL